MTVKHITRLRRVKVEARIRNDAVTLYRFCVFGGLRYSNGFVHQKERRLHVLIVHLRTAFLPSINAAVLSITSDVAITASNIP